MGIISVENNEREAKKKTTTLSFRIDRDVTQKLQEKADEKNISLNGLINRYPEKIYGMGYIFPDQSWHDSSIKASGKRNISQFTN